MNIYYNKYGAYMNGCTISIGPAMQCNVYECDT